MDNNQAEEFKKVYSEFLKVVSMIKGLFFDFNLAILTLLDFFNSNQQTALMLVYSNPDGPKSIDDLDRLPLLYSNGSPGESDAKIVFNSTQGEFKERNKLNGVNHLFISNMVLVTLYQYWENYYRPKLAKILHISTSNIKCDTLYEIKLLRDSIIHHDSIAIKKCSKMKIFTWFKPGDQIIIDGERLLMIVQRLHEVTFKFENLNQGV